MAPAFDVTYAYNPSGTWTARHQMSVNGKRQGITMADLLAVADEMNIRKGREVVGDVVAAARRWPEFAAQVQVEVETSERIGATHRLGKS